MTTLGHNGGPPLDRDTSYPDRDGFITVGRSIRNHPIVGFGVKGPYVPAEAWLDLIMECKYREGRVVNAGHLMTIRPGQMVGAVSWLAQRWGWTPKQVRHFLDRLEGDGMITRGFGEDQKSDSGATVEKHGNQKGNLSGNQNGKHKGKQAHFLTICNYAIYQFVQEKMGQINGQTEGQTQGQASGQIEVKSEANKGQQYIEEQRNTGIQEDKEKEKEGLSSSPVQVSVVTTPAPLSQSVLIPEPPRQEADSVHAYEAFHAYNQLAQRLNLPTARTLTPSRRKALCARLSEHGPESWAIALANIERSAFLRGRNDRNWRANFDFIVQVGSYAKLVDGVYGNGAHAGDESAGESYFARMARLGGVDLTQEIEGEVL